MQTVLTSVDRAALIPKKRARRSCTVYPHLFNVKIITTHRHSQLPKTGGTPATTITRGSGRGAGMKYAPNATPRGGQQKGPSSRVINRTYQSQIRCTVESCRSRMNEPRKLFYPIPTAPGTRKIWTDLIRRHSLGFGPISTNYVCSDHFSADQKLPNGHLKGNAVPNIFSVQRRGIVDCLYCGMSFENRGRLHSHDSIIHLHESRRWKLECEVESVPPSSLYDGKSSCKDCERRNEVYEQMEGLRRDITQLTNELNEFTEVQLGGRLQLNFPTPCEETFAISDDKTQTIQTESEIS
ncbi:uncharacterized protein LOC111261224 isoform X2 [Varroa jacobsoni]|uniref:uncharacterized protein LOC111261224 isoform X2 n=1 Tax=Varroa jacobsoni TaxID=62625 RepID=UPI000BF2D493|nr:uncharacterized protein LOC111261224 isoform X2 [Varroa jacobsoni]